jgi:hypothetical protein
MSRLVMRSMIQNGFHPFWDRKKSYEKDIPFGKDEVLYKEECF